MTTTTRGVAAAARSTRPAPITDWLDDELLLLMRSGDAAAYGEIFRRYEPEIRRFARSLVSRDDVDDVVSDSFTKVLAAIENGNGPVDHPERYLMVTVRTTAGAMHRRRATQVETAEKIWGDRSMVETALPLDDPALQAAFRSLPDRARRVLWATIVEERDHADIGAELGISRNAVAALAYRQRHALRAAYLEQCRLAD